jgi:hypothetical protein
MPICHPLATNSNQRTSSNPTCVNSLNFSRSAHLVLTLVPISYYCDYDLTALCSTLNGELVEFGEGNGVTLGFEFLGTDDAVNATADRVRSVIGAGVLFGWLIKSPENGCEKGR